MLLTMNKLEIIGPKKYFYQALAVLHNLGTLHVEDLSKKEDMILKSMDVDEEASKSKESLRNLLTRLNGVITAIEPLNGSKKSLSGKELALLSDKNTAELNTEADKLLTQLEEKTRNIAGKKSKMELELASLDRYQEVMQKVYPLAKSIVALKGSETIAFLLEGDYKDTVNIINKEMAKITNENHELISTPIDENTTAAIIVFNKKYSAKVHNFLRDKVSQLNLPTDMKDLTIDGVIRQIEKKQAEYPKEIDDFQKQLDNISSDWYHKLKAVSNAIYSKIDQIENIPSFGQTEYTFVIHGWLPHKNVQELKKEMNKAFGSKVLVRQLELSPEDLHDAPVVMENRPWVKPYEMLINGIKGAPKYGTIDPSFFMAIFFPIFFGFIVGDVGYGLIVLVTATVMRYKFKDHPIGSLMRIFQVAGISTILFGAFYGEGFGNILEHFLESRHIEFQIGSLHIPYHRDPEIAGRMMQLLIISAAFGYIHLITSLAMGIVNAVREKAKKHAIERLGLIIFLLAFALRLAGPDLLKTPALLLLVGGVVLVGYGGGALALFETIGLLANVASYFRLMAIGLAGAILASVANSFPSILGLELGILMAVVLHALNIVVHTFSPAIHSLRLNLIEGFGKFYEEGGKEYKPFKARR